MYNMDYEEEIKLFDEYTAKVYSNIGACTHEYTVYILKNGETIRNHNGSKKISWKTDSPKEFCEKYTKEQLSKDEKRIGI